MVQETLKTEKDSEVDGRKWSKPIMEKRRRERINRSLEELKRLVLEAQNRDSSRYTKLEKADILEMTVRHLRALRYHQRAVFAASDPRLLSKYRADYNECMAEVSKHMTSQDGVDPDMKSRILSHLAGCCRSTRTENQVDSSVTTAVSTSCPYITSSDFKRRRIFPREPKAVSSSLPTYLSPPYSALSSGSLPLQSSAPVTLLPIYGTGLGDVQGMSPVLPSSPPSTLQLRDPLWRPW